MIIAGTGLLLGGGQHPHFHWRGSCGLQGKVSAASIVSHPQAPVHTSTSSPPPLLSLTMLLLLLSLLLPQCPANMDFSAAAAAAANLIDRLLHKFTRKLGAMTHAARSKACLFSPKLAFLCITLAPPVTTLMRHPTWPVEQVQGLQVCTGWSKTLPSPSGSDLMLCLFRQFTQNCELFGSIKNVDI